MDEEDIDGIETKKSEILKNHYILAHNYILTFKISSASGLKLLIIIIGEIDIFDSSSTYFNGHSCRQGV